MSTEAERILILRLAAGELDALEVERARSLIEREPDLGELFEQLQDLQSRVPAAFPEPPSPGDQRSFVELMQRLSAGSSELGDLAGAWQPRQDRVSLSRGDWSLGEDRRAFDVTTSRMPAFRGTPASSMARRPTAPSPGAHLFNLREIRREEGLPVELEFYAGDVLAIHNEVLLVSAFSGSYLPTPGSVFGAIAERYGISFEQGAPPDTRRYPEGLLHFSAIACPAFDSLWVVELREPGQTFSLANLRSALRDIGGRLSEMLADASSITLPLLGTGNQRIDPRDVAREILSAIPHWARNPRLRTIRVFTLELEHIAVLNRALDDRDFSVANSALFLACEQLRRILEREDLNEPLRMALKNLHQIASAPDPSVQSIALEGRRIAESMLRKLAGEEDMDTGFSPSDASPANQADLAAPHIRLLLDLSRLAAAGERVDPDDAVMVLRASMRLAEMARTSEARR